VYGLLNSCGGKGKGTADAGGDGGQQADGGADAGPDRPASIDGWDIPTGTTLKPEQYALVAALFDALIPGDESSPGAHLTNAAWYLDQLLGAFNVSPPRVFAGGPYSGRHGGLDGFSKFLPLTRVEEICWRTYIEGSMGIPEREFNGPVKGIADRYLEGLAALSTAAKKQNGKPFTQLGSDERRSLLMDADKDFIQMAYEHVIEGTYGDPVYGGNLDMKGWKAIDFEGDRQPVGFTARQLSHPEEG
jgi:hypothetical protein